MLEEMGCHDRPCILQSLRGSAPSFPFSVTLQDNWADPEDSFLRLFSQLDCGEVEHGEAGRRWGKLPEWFFLSAPAGSHTSQASLELAL